MIRFMLIISAAFLFAACGDEAPEAEDPVEEENEESTEQETEASEEETEDESKTDVPEVIADLQLSDVRNDNTGEWQKAVTSADVNMPDNALAYYNEYMDSGDTHYIVSFATNTTIALSEMSGQLYVDISEYQDGEEHDASELGSGMLLKSYAVNTDDGSIEEME